MKKKLTVILIALACAIACAFGVSACANIIGGGGGGNKNFNDLVAVDSQGTEHNDEYDLGEIVYGTSPDLDYVKLYAKFSDNSKEEVSKDDSDLTIEYYFDGVQLSAKPATWTPGDYAVYYYYQYENRTGTVYVSFEVITTQTATPYELSLEKDTWKYKEENEMTVKLNGTALTKNFQIYFIAEDKYEEIKGKADFAEQLKDNSEQYYSKSAAKPGTYYFFAYVSNKYNSDFVKGTVEKLDLTIKHNEFVPAYFTYDYEKTGKIKLSGIRTDLYASSHPYAVNGDDETVNGDFVWKNPDEEVDSRNSGETRWLSFVPLESDVYSVVENAAAATLTINKGYVVKPYNNDPQATYTGENIAVNVGPATKNYVYLVTAVEGEGSDSRTTQILDAGNQEAIIDLVKDDGVYNYTLSLKDNVNFFWIDYLTYVSITADKYPQYYDDVADVRFTFTVNPKDSYVNFPYEMTQLVINKDGEVKIEIADYVSPYKKGTLTAVWQAKDAQGANSSYVTANVSIQSEGGKDYLVMTGTEHNDTLDTMFVKFTAAGDDHYADIDTVARLEVLKKPNPHVDSYIKVVMGTTAGQLFEKYPQLKTTAGDWVLKYNGMTIEDSATVLPGAHQFTLSFDNSNLLEDTTVNDIIITIVGVDVPHCPVSAGQNVTVAAGTTLSEWLATLSGLEVPDIGKWVIWMDNGVHREDWIKPGDNMQFEAGVYKFKFVLEFTELAITPADVEFTITVS